jgi:hypothetical protein
MKQLLEELILKIDNLSRYDLDQEEEQWATMERYCNGDFLKYEDVIDLISNLNID